MICSFAICSCSLFPAEAAGEHFTSALIAEPELFHRLVHLWFNAHANYLVFSSVYFQQAAAAAITDIRDCFPPGTEKFYTGTLSTSKYERQVDEIWLLISPFFGVFTPIYHHHLCLLFSLHSSLHPRSPVSHPPLLSALGRDAIFPADLLILNDACKLLLSIAGFIYLLTNYYPWCLALCCIVCVWVPLQAAVIKYPGPLLVQPALSVYLHPLTLGGTLTLWPLRHIHMHEYTHIHTHFF